MSVVPSVQTQYSSIRCPGMINCTNFPFQKRPRLDSSFYGRLSRSHLFLFPLILSGHCQCAWKPFLLYVPSGRQQLADRLTSSLSSSSCPRHLVMAFMEWAGKKNRPQCRLLEVWVWKRNVPNGNGFSKLGL